MQDESSQKQLQQQQQQQQQQHMIATTAGTTANTSDSCGKRCCKEIKCSQGWFDLNDEPGRILDVRASFGPSTIASRCFKVVYTGWMISALVQNWIKKRETAAFFLAYLTYWTAILVSLWGLLSTYNSFVPLPQPLHAATSSSTTTTGVVSVRTKISWLFFSLVAGLTAVVTLLFWTVEYDYSIGGVPDYLVIMVHGVSFVLTWMEGLLINRIPVRWKHVLPTMILGSLYITWTVIHQLATDIGNPNKSDNDPDTNDDLIYGVLDYKDNTLFAVILDVGVVFVVVPLIHWILWLLSLYSFPCGGCRGTNRRYLQHSIGNKDDECITGVNDDEENQDIN